MKYLGKELSKDLHNAMFGLTLADVAKKTKISRATVCRLKQGKEPSILSYASICKFLNKPLSQYIK